MASYKERYTAQEGKTVRLYLRNYVSNVLTDADSTPTVYIRPRNGSTTLTTLTPTRESVGVYYADWAVPSSVVTSQKYSETFTGSGYYNDVWSLTIGGSSTTRPFVYGDKKFCRWWW